jgi:hypothetical protein
VSEANFDALTAKISECGQLLGFRVYSEASAIQPHEIHYVWAVTLGLKKRIVKLEVSDIRRHRQQHNSSYAFSFNTEGRNAFSVFEDTRQT